MTATISRGAQNLLSGQERVVPSGMTPTTLRPNQRATGVRAPVYFGADGRHRLPLSWVAAYVGRFEPLADVAEIWGWACTGYETVPPTVEPDIVRSADGVQLADAGVLIAAASSEARNGLCFPCVTLVENAAKLCDLAACLLALDAKGETGGKNRPTVGR